MHFIRFGRKEEAARLNHACVNIGGTVINSEPNLKLLRVSIDRDLSFSNHVTLCQKAGRYINILPRMTNELTA